MLLLAFAGRVQFWYSGWSRSIVASRPALQSHSRKIPHIYGLQYGQAVGSLLLHREVGVGHFTSCPVAARDGVLKPSMAEPKGDVIDSASCGLGEADRASTDMLEMMPPNETKWKHDWPVAMHRACIRDGGQTSLSG